MLKTHIVGFDYLRAIFTVLVVVWHADGVSFIGRMQPSCQWVVDLFYYNICLLAVPVFIQMSLFIFYCKQVDDNRYLLKKRIPSLIAIYIAWMSIGVIFNSSFGNINYLLQLTSIKAFLLLLVTGSRPELYFLFSLIFVTFVAAVNIKILSNQKNSIYIQSLLLFISLVIITCLNIATISTHQAIFSVYWNPICFLPYVFSSSILVSFCSTKELDKNFSLHKKIFVLILSIIFLLLLYLEWSLLNLPEFFDNYLLPPYTRISLVFGTFIVSYCSTLVKKQPSPIIQKLSKQSLAIFLIHGYILYFFSKIDYTNIWLRISFNPISKVIIAVVLCIIASYFIRKFKAGRLILNSNSK